MNRDELISMARDAGLSITPPRSGQYDGGRVGCDVVGLKRFAALVAAREREECANVAKRTCAADRNDYCNGFNQSAINIEEKIIARGWL